MLHNRQFAPDSDCEPIDHLVRLLLTDVQIAAVLHE